MSLGANINFTQSHVFLPKPSPLVIAFRGGHNNLAKYLITTYGADTAFCVGELSILAEVCKQGDLDSLKLVIANAGILPDEVVGIALNTDLVFKQFTCFNYLLARCPINLNCMYAYPNLITEHCYPLHLAVICAQFECFQALIAAGASIYVLDRTGRDVLSLAKSKQNFNLIDKCIAMQ